MLEVVEDVLVVLAVGFVARERFIEEDVGAGAESGDESGVHRGVGFGTRL